MSVCKFLTSAAAVLGGGGGAAAVSMTSHLDCDAGNCWLTIGHGCAGIPSHFFTTCRVQGLSIAETYRIEQLDHRPPGAGVK